MIFMRDGIKDTVQRLLGNTFKEDNDWNIHFGYDCITIEIKWGRSVTLDFLNRLSDEFETELVWVEGNKTGGIDIGCDISTIILQAFGGSWKEYEKAYGINWMNEHLNQKE